LYPFYAEHFTETAALLPHQWSAFGPTKLAGFLLASCGGRRYIHGFMSSQVPADLKYTKSHEWVRVSGETATVGITDHAQHELTDVVFVELPAIGRIVKAGEATSVVESVKTASDIYSPVSGEVIAVNAGVSENPALVNSDPYRTGSFFTVRLSSPAEVSGLLDPSAYAAQVGA